MVSVVEGLTVGVLMVVANVVVAGVIARRVSKAAAEPNGFRAEMGRRAAVDYHARQDRQREAQEAEAAAKAKAATARAAAGVQALTVAALERQRVGTRFTAHPGPDKANVDLTVDGLDPRSPLDRVIVSRTPTAGSAPDGWLGQVSVRWSALTESPSVQRHRNARVVLGSLDDAEGWVTYERKSASAASGGDRATSD